MKGKIRWLRSGVVAFSTAMAVMAPARAAEPPSTTTAEITARERPVTRSFYGWQILATGEVGGILAAAAIVLPDSPLKTLPSTVGFIVGAPLYLLGGPATHWTHGEFQKGLISFAASFALPIMGGFVGQAVRCAPDDAEINCATRGFVTGASIALVTVPVVDAFVLGWEDIPADDPLVSAGARARPASKAQPRFTMTPAWLIGPKGAFEVGVVGRF